MGALFAKPMLMLGMVVVGLIALAVVARNWSCRPVKPPRPPISREYTVVSVPSGGTIEVSKGRKRTAIVWLADIVPPPEGSTWFEPSRQNLERLAGKSIRVESPRRGLFRGTPDGENEDDAYLCRQLDSALDGDNELAVDGRVEARGPIVGVIFGSGGCLQLGQIMDGWAGCVDDAPKEWQKQAVIAQKNKVGMWAKP